MLFRLRYQVRGDWTLVDVTRVDVPADERAWKDEPERVRGRIMFRTYEWNLLFCRLGFTGPVGLAGEREMVIP